jgi:rhamnosyltransferase
MVFPKYKDLRLGTALPSHASTDGYAPSCITSGAMINAEIFRTLGLMEEQLFIDYVDIEFSLRMRAAGFKIVESSNALLAHSLGHIVTRKMFNRSFFVTNHSPQRRYYITRNRSLLIARYFPTYPGWALLDLLGFLKDMLKILLFESQKLLKFRYIALALRDAAKGRLNQQVKL